MEGWSGADRSGPSSVGAWLLIVQLDTASRRRSSHLHRLHRLQRPGGGRIPTRWLSDPSVLWRVESRRRTLRLYQHFPLLNGIRPSNSQLQPQDFSLRRGGVHSDAEPYGEQICRRLNELVSPSSCAAPELLLLLLQCRQSVAASGVGPTSSP